MSLHESGTAQSMEDFAEASKEESAAKQKGNRRSSQEKVNYGDYALSVETVEKLLNDHEIESGRKDKQNETIFELKNCLENDQHTKKAWVKIDKQGNVTAGCQAERCKWGFPRFYYKLVGEWPQWSKQEVEPSKEQEELAEMSGLHWTTNKQGQEVLIANIHNVAGYLANKSLPIWYDSFLRKIKM